MKWVIHGLRYFGQAPPTEDKVASLRLMGRLVSLASSCGCPADDVTRGIHKNNCVAPRFGVAPLLPGKAPSPAAWPVK